MPHSPIERIAKIIARRGFCSRRKAEELISSGRVQFQGVVVSTLGLKIPLDAELKIDDNILAQAQPSQLWAFHKPRGCLTTHSDPQARPTMFELLPAQLGRVISVGRLDFNSEGLIILSNDGTITRRLELPSSGIKRVYRCRVYGALPTEMFQELRHGICIEDVNYGPIDCRRISSSDNQHWLEFVLYEGKNRELRKICQHFGLRVSRLIRTKYGNIALGTLEPSKARPLSPIEICELLAPCQ